MRRKLDQYYTPSLAVRQFLDSLDFGLSGVILEPCNGEGAISKELVNRGYKVITNDLDSDNKADTHFDLAVPLNWMLIEDVDFIITNPPFNLASEIISLAHQKAKRGVIALLRLSFIEPCLNRSEFLTINPPNQMIVTPRISFTGKGTDNITTAWFIWLKDEDLRASIKQPIRVLSK
ncbi:hypothetical protein [Cyanobacterium sp. Dongsha4]|uniref:hypothetical protein n=1 Tax=Cyanobacterium sp. DS4 TaxID=2878255 RepID=UPI002E815162|nr:hypothetical protein [Cyanobacterium sp. Dongsha4]WVL02511.1 hypothetical protein Dongsha4_18625 [Cyanobacterium sp. Dongsha4]